MKKSFLILLLSWLCLPTVSEAGLFDIAGDWLFSGLFNSRDDKVVDLAKDGRVTQIDRNQDPNKCYIRVNPDNTDPLNGNTKDLLLEVSRQPRGSGIDLPFTEVLVYEFRTFTDTHTYQHRLGQPFFRAKFTAGDKGPRDNDGYVPECFLSISDSDNVSFGDKCPTLQLGPAGGMAQEFNEAWRTSPRKELFDLRVVEFKSLITSARKCCGDNECVEELREETADHRKPYFTYPVDSSGAGATSTETR